MVAGPILGRDEQLALEDGPDDVFDVGTAELAGAAQALDHLADDAFLGAGAQLRDDRIADHEVGHAHACYSVIPRSIRPGQGCPTPRRPRGSGDGPGSSL